MGMSKSIKVILSLALVVFLALASIKVEATRYITYPSINHGDHATHCDKAHPNTCKKKEANPYKRGCEILERCRGGSTPRA
ncbi:unnamed protein product [Arabidopsis lyrata]|uniref:Uncharacterized protein n=1 Tax=Arabidopsis lyrata subsp. lyrata TaxID=81972 RepID=D7KVJ4_ARALL|nr:protein RALF-like 9 [Arabidopsis lyrata subsp. lyrata]EFH62790.1 hypothetical protein ARALYDRAFT_893358 [Arabidopsis lyrata subsp. lyrata]CAH8256233.1 unnamed protein product [Arabidopsis lyrata]|eukprot:XP_002886531.1 protein RALF-like 9 [Arabidopsis lyrata subsp. lyrata]